MSSGVCNRTWVKQKLRGPYDNSISDTVGPWATVSWFKVLPYLMFSFSDPKSVISILNYLHLKFSSVYVWNPHWGSVLVLDAYTVCVHFLIQYLLSYHVNYEVYLSFADWSCYLLFVFEWWCENLWEFNASVFPSRWSEDKPLRSW